MYTVDQNNISVYFKKSTIFSGLNQIERNLVEEKSSLQTFESGATIIEQGDETTTVYFLLSGTVHVLDYSRSHRAVTYASLKDGDMFGEMAAIDGMPRSAWVCAISTCKVICLPGTTFLNLLKSNNDICLKILKMLSSRLRLSDEKLTDVSLFGTEQRICIELVRMSKLDATDQNNVYQIKQMPTQANFANIIGSTRETVSRILAKLRDDSVIIKTDNGFVIPDRTQLEKRAFL
jgi:CRP/FNR family transcriptional regulator, cyclic AMP receptor protein